MIVLGVDIGSKRTAFCAVEISGEEKKIIFWELMSPRDYQIICSCCQKNSATTVAHWKNSDGEFTCKKHGGINKCSPDFCDRFLHYLDTTIFPLNIDVACPEIQVSPKNDIIYFIFKMWCLGIPTIDFRPVHSKTKVSWIPNVRPTSEFNSHGKKRAKRYKYLKTEMVKLVLAKFKTETYLAPWYSFFHSFEKKDDLAEAYLNAIMHATA